MLDTKTAMEAAEDSVLVTLREGRADTVPLFLLHDADGETMLYRHLAERLCRDRPTVALRPPDVPDSSIEKTAATCERDSSPIGKTCCLRQFAPMPSIGWRGALVSHSVVTWRGAVLLQKKAMKVAQVFKSTFRRQSRERRLRARQQHRRVLDPNPIHILRRAETKIPSGLPTDMFLTATGGLQKACSATPKNAGFADSPAGVQQPRWRALVDDIACVEYMGHHGQQKVLYPGKAAMVRLQRQDRIDGAFALVSAQT